MKQTAFLKPVTAAVREVVDARADRFTLADVFRDLQSRHPNAVVPRNQLGSVLSLLVEQGRIRVVGLQEKKHACQYMKARVFETVARAVEAEGEAQR